MLHTFAVCEATKLRKSLVYFSLISWIGWTLLLDAVQPADGLRLVAFGTFTQSNHQITTNDDYMALTTIFPLAIDHFNNRSRDVIPTLPEMLQNCPNTKIDLIEYLDDGNQEQVAMEELVKLLAGRTSDDYIADGIIGPIKSAIAQPIASTASALGIPVVSHWATSTALSNKRNYPLFARTTPTDEGVAVAIADLFVNLGYKRVGLLYSDETYGNALKNALFNACEQERGIRLVTVLFEDSQQSVDNAVNSIKSEDVNIIVYVFLSDHIVGYLARAAAKHDMLKNKLWISTINDLTLADDEFPNNNDRTLIQQFLRGSLHIISTVPGLASFPGLPQMPNPFWKNLQRVWENLDEKYMNSIFAKYHGNVRNFQLPPGYFKANIGKAAAPWTWAYDAVLAYGLAACKCVSDGLSDACASHLYRNRNNGQILFNRILGNSFLGVSGHVSFLPNGDRDPRTSSYILRNAQLNSNGVGLQNKAVGVWVPQQSQNGSWALVPGSSIQFGVDGSANPPPETTIPYHEQEHLSIWAKAMGYVEAIIVYIACLWAFGFVCIHRSHIVMIRSQPHFLMLLNLGCIILGTSIIPLTIESNWACMAFPWLFGVGFTLALSALQAKSWRVYILWRNPGFHKTKKTRKGKFYLGMVIFVVSVEISLLIAWTVMAPLQNVRITTVFSDKGYPLVSYGTCQGNHPSSAIFLGFLLTLNTLVLLGTIYISFLVRNAPDEFHEAKSTFVAGGAVMCVYFLGIPTVAALYSSPIGRFLGLSSIIFLTSMGLFFAMYVPRIREIRNGTHHGSYASRSSDETRSPSPAQERRQPLRKDTPNFMSARRPDRQVADWNVRAAYVERIFSRAKAVRDEDEDEGEKTEASMRKAMPQNPSTVESGAAPPMKGGTIIFFEDKTVQDNFSKGSMSRQSDLMAEKPKKRPFQEVTLT